MRNLCNIIDTDSCNKVAFKGLSEREACKRAEMLNLAVGRSRYRIARQGGVIGLD